MAKKKNNKKKFKFRITMLGFSVIFFILALFAEVASSLWVNNKQIELTMEIQNMQAEIASIKKDNQLLENDITALKAPDRIYEIASAAGLTRAN